jgi:hypothetical protein
LSPTGRTVPRAITHEAYSSTLSCSTIRESECRDRPETAAYTLSYQLGVDKENLNQARTRHEQEAKKAPLIEGSDAVSASLNRSESAKGKTSAIFVEGGIDPFEHLIEQIQSQILI